MGGNLGYAVAIIFIYLIRYIISTIKNKNGNFLLVSLFLVLCPFEITKNLTTYDPNLATGALGSTIAVYISLVIALFIFFVMRWKKTPIAYNSRYNFVSITFLFIFISLVNPYNVSSRSSLIFAIFFSSHIFLFYMFSKLMQKELIVKGIYDGLKLLVIVQLLLAICFPILNIVAVTNLFHEGSEIWATRLGGRVGAVGLFKHPGNLALFTIMSASFFIACFLANYNKKLSSILVIACVATVVLTFSRTSLIALIIVMFAVYYIFKNSKKNIFSLGNVLKVIVPLSIALYWLIFLSPFSASFIESDASSQVDNRMIHFFMAFKIFTDSPILGVGLNSHLGYISQNFGIAQAFTTDEFYLHNPIHNSHLIVLTETGIFGFAMWIYFLFTGIIKSKNQIANRKNVILSCTLIGVLVGYMIYGMSGWAPMSPSILSFFIFYAYFTLIY